MIELGGVYAPTLAVFDQNGNLTNATNIALAITLPDGSVATPVVLNPPAITGQYTASYQTVQPGRHTVRWTSSGPSTAYTDVFDVLPAASPAFFSLADAKQQLGIATTYTADDTELRAKLRGITKAMENYKHEVIVARQFVEENMVGSYWWNSWPAPFGGHLRLLHVPVINLQTMQSADGIATWDVNNFDVRRDSGIVYWIRGPALNGRVRTMHLAGYQIIPDNYIEAGKIMLQHLWESRRGPGGVDGVIGPEELADYRHFTALPRKALEWLGPQIPVVM